MSDDDGREILTMHFAGPDDDGPLQMISKKKLDHLVAVKQAAIHYLNAVDHANKERNTFIDIVRNYKG